MYAQYGGLRLFRECIPISLHLAGWIVKLFPNMGSLPLKIQLHSSSRLRNFELAGFLETSAPAFTSPQ
jgi:hypothetical protein